MTDRADPGPAELLGTRLRRLLDLLDGGVAAVQAELGLDGLRPRFSPVVRVLAASGPRSIRDVATAIGVTHSAASQTVAQLAARGLVALEPGQDGRQRIVRLTAEAERLLPALDTEWAATTAAARALDAELAYPLTALVDEALAALDRTPMDARIRRYAAPMSTGTDAGMLRPATAEDVPAVAAIWRAGWRDGHLGNVPDELVAVRTPESFGTRAAERVADTTVATVDGEVAGFVMLAGDEVEQVYVDTRYRGGGVAAALLAEAERLVAAAGHDTAWLAVVAGNARARRFYERHGWTDEGLFDHSAPSASGPVSVPAHRYVKRLGP